MKHTINIQANQMVNTSLGETSHTNYFFFCTQYACTPTNYTFKLLFLLVLVFFFSHSLTIRNGIDHVERGEYEEINGQTVFIVRGFFRHITKNVSVAFSIFNTTDAYRIHVLLLFIFLALEQGIQVTAYIFDHAGYHEIPFNTDEDGISDLYGPNQDECDIKKGVYCIDRILLSLMVG